MTILCPYCSKSHESALTPFDKEAQCPHCKAKIILWEWDEPPDEPLHEPRGNDGTPTRNRFNYDQ